MTQAFAEDTATKTKKISNKAYDAALQEMQVELVKLQEWVRQEGERILLIFEGRDAAGKGGTIKRLTQSLSPRVARVVALPAPTEREKGQWYFQRYIEHLPAAGEIAIFDRSWYNRAGVERVMGFCTDEEYWEFFTSVCELERMLARSGLTVIKYWFSVSDAEQERRFKSRLTDPLKRWKLSPMDLDSRQRWVDYSRAKDEMMARTNIPEARWHVVNADVKKHARLNCIQHFLDQIPYKDVLPEDLDFGERPEHPDYVRPPFSSQNIIPEPYTPGST